MWFPILLDTNIRSESKVSGIYYLSSFENQVVWHTSSSPWFSQDYPPSGFIITLACSFNILKNSRHLKQPGFREVWGGGQSIPALLGKVGGCSVSNSENAEVGVWAIPGPGIDAVVPGLRRRWLVLFYYDIPTDDPADGVSQNWLPLVRHTETFPLPSNKKSF